MAQSDEVDRIVDAWSRERPDLDFSPLQVLSRVGRLSRHVDRARKAAFAASDLELWEFDVMSALRRAGAPYQLSPKALAQLEEVPLSQAGYHVRVLKQMGAIEVAQTLAENNARLRHPLEVIIFQNEEGGTTGSTAISHGLDDARLGLVTNSKRTVREGIRFLGGDPDKLASVVRKPGDLAAYVELHIEQGGRLHNEKINIGVVE